MNETQKQNPMSAIAAAAVGAGISTIGGLFTNASNKRLAREQMAWQSREAEIAYNRQLALIDKQNAYNDPSAAMARLQNAGLNPALIYGSGAGQLSSASPSSVPQASGGAMARLENPVANVGQLVSDTFFSLKRLENETRIADAQVDAIKSGTRGQDIDNRYKEQTFDDNAAILGLSRQAAELGIDLQKHDIDLRKLQKENSKLTNEGLKYENVEKSYRSLYYSYLEGFAEEKVKADLIQQYVAINLAYQQGEYTKVQAKLAPTLANIQKIAAMAARTNAAANWKNAQTNEYSARQQAALGWKNAEINEKNAQTNERNSWTNMYNAQTTREKSRADIQQGQERNDIDREARTKITEKDIFNALVKPISESMSLINFEGGFDIDLSGFRGGDSYGSGVPLLPPSGGAPALPRSGGKLKLPRK